MKSIKKEIRKAINSVRKPNDIPQDKWTSALNWAMAVWQCRLSRQRWTHEIAIVSPGHYLMLCDDKGEFIIRDRSLWRFMATTSNKNWVSDLKQLIEELRAAGELSEALKWEGVYKKLLHDLHMGRRTAKSANAQLSYKRIMINKAA